jgi:hypothetical protein
MSEFAPAFRREMPHSTQHKHTGGNNNDTTSRRTREILFQNGAQQQVQPQLYSCT